MTTHRISNQPLAKPLRTQLENAVKSARDVAEKGARAALAQLAVGAANAPDYLTDELKALRREAIEALRDVLPDAVPAALFQKLKEWKKRKSACCSTPEKQARAASGGRR